MASVDRVVRLLDVKDVNIPRANSRRTLGYDLATLIRLPLSSSVRLEL